MYLGKLRNWYDLSLARSQRNVGAVIALEIAIEAVAPYATQVAEHRCLARAIDYLEHIRIPSTGRPSLVVAASHRWIRSAPRLANTRGERDDVYGSYCTHIIELTRVVRAVKRFFDSYTGGAYRRGLDAIHQACQLAHETDLVDSEYQAFAL